MHGMALSSMGDGGSVHKGESFANVGLTTGLIVPYLCIVFVGLHILLRVRINYYACGCFITRVDDFLRVRILI